MTPDLKGRQWGSLPERAKRLMFQPDDEWRAIDVEPMTIAGIYKGWVLPLAAIGPVATLIASLVFGFSFVGVIYRPSILGATGTALVSYGLSLGSVFALALIVDALAPSFGGVRNQVQAVKVAAFAMTAAWLAGIFAMLPMIALLSIAGVYSVYLLFVGLPILMRVPQDRALAYTVVSVLAAAVLFIVAAAMTSAVDRIFTPPIALA